jgi:hypothetical protein
LCNFITVTAISGFSKPSSALAFSNKTLLRLQTVLLRLEVSSWTIRAILYDGLLHTSHNKGERDSLFSLPLGWALFFWANLLRRVHRESSPGKSFVCERSGWVVCVAPLLCSTAIEVSMNIHALEHMRKQSQHRFEWKSEA